MKKYEIGDIVFVSEYEYNNGRIGKNHLFVIIDADDEQLIPIIEKKQIINPNLNLMNY